MLYVGTWQGIIVYKCRSYIGETRRHLEVRIKEHRYSLKQGAPEQSKLLHYMYVRRSQNMPDRSEGLADSPEHHLQNCKEAAHTPLVGHPSIQPSLDISPMWTDVIREDVIELHLSPVSLA